MSLSNEMAQIPQITVPLNAATSDGPSAVVDVSGINGVTAFQVSNGTGICTLTVQGSFDKTFTVAQNALTLGVIRLTDSSSGVNLSRAIISGVLSVSANTTSLYAVVDPVPFLRVVVSGSAGLSGCTVTLFAIPI